MRHPKTFLAAFRHQIMRFYLILYEWRICLCLVQHLWRPLNIFHVLISNARPLLNETGAIPAGFVAGMAIGCKRGRCRLRNMVLSVCWAELWRILMLVRRWRSEGRVSRGTIGRNMKFIVATRAAVVSHGCVHGRQSTLCRIAWVRCVS